MATRQPRARKPAAEKAKTASGLLDALKFVSVAQHSDGTIMQMHCRLTNGQLIAFDGGIAAGHLIEEALNVCPHTATFIRALERCTGNISITQLASGKLSVKSGKFSATVPCVGLDDLPGVEPDPPIAKLTDDLKRALGACIPLAGDGLPEAFMCGVMLQANTAVATNRIVVIEAWHGIDLPPNVLLPKVSANAIAKSSKPLKAFGYSGRSATFWFEDDSFIKTQLFEDKFPDYQRILNIDSNAYPLPGGFYEAIDTVMPFTEDGRVYFIDGKISSRDNTIDAATYEVEGLQNDLAFNGKFLEIIRPHAHRMHFNAAANGLALFFAEDGLTRGGIMPIRSVVADKKPVPF